MRIIHITQSVTGGIASYLEEIVGHQSGLHGAENVFFLVPDGSADHLPSINPEQVITFPTRGRNPLGLLAFGRMALGAIERIDPTIVHLHSTFAGAVVRPLLALRRERPRVVYCPHGWAFGMEVSAVRRRLYAACEILFSRLTDVIIVNSESERSLGLRYGIPAKKMQVIRNGIAPRLARVPENAQPPIHLAFVGRHDCQKGLDILLGEMERQDCEHIHLHVVGKSVVDGAPPILRMPRNVTFYGWLSRAEVLALLRKMDALVMPSRWEAFGLTAIEAMRTGIPVIASNRGALPEIVRHGVDGLIVDIGKPGDLGRVLAGLSRAQLRDYGKAARVRFRTEFTSARMNSLIDALYERVLAGELPAAQPLEGAASPIGGVAVGQLRNRV